MTQLSAQKMYEITLQYTKYHDVFANVRAMMDYAPNITSIDESQAAIRQNSAALCVNPDHEAAFREFYQKFPHLSGVEANSSMLEGYFRGLERVSCAKLEALCSDPRVLQQLTVNQAYTEQTHRQQAMERQAKKEVDWQYRAVEEILSNLKNPDGSLIKTMVGREKEFEAKEKALFLLTIPELEQRLTEVRTKRALASTSRRDLHQQLRERDSVSQAQQMARYPALPKTMIMRGSTAYKPMNIDRDYLRHLAVNDLEEFSRLVRLYGNEAVTARMQQETV